MLPPLPFSRKAPPEYSVALIPPLFGTEDVAGITWNVWVGPRGDGPEGPNDAFVVSFVAPSDIASGSYDLKEFFTAAEGYGISSSMYLTDMFFGFEIWQGGGGGNLKVDSFTAKVE